MPEQAQCNKMRLVLAASEPPSILPSVRAYRHCLGSYRERRPQTSEAGIVQIFMGVYLIGLIRG
jgi:hypothetical protein